jgi:hypothetical protein
MAAKDLRFSTDARDRILRGVEILNNAVKITLGPKVIPAIPGSRCIVREGRPCAGPKQSFAAHFAAHPVTKVRPALRRCSPALH